jgi:hypothetical protein
MDAVLEFNRGAISIANTRRGCKGEMKWKSIYKLYNNDKLLILVLIYYRYVSVVFNVGI